MVHNESGEYCKDTSVVVTQFSTAQHMDRTDCAVWDHSSSEAYMPLYISFSSLYNAEPHPTNCIKCQTDYILYAGSLDLKYFFSSNKCFEAIISFVCKQIQNRTVTERFKFIVI